MISHRKRYESGGFTNVYDAIKRHDIDVKSLVNMRVICCDAVSGNERVVDEHERILSVSSGNGATVEFDKDVNGHSGGQQRDYGGLRGKQSHCWNVRLENIFFEDFLIESDLEDVNDSEFEYVVF